MTNEVLELTMKELERIVVLRRVLVRELTQVAAAKILGISDRQVRNLLRSFSEEGENSCISKKRGKPSNRCLPNKHEVLDVVKSYYSDFSPKLASEYLVKNHAIKISKETLRHWMSEAQLWIPRKIKGKNQHPLRDRRPMFGELIQVDGSHHYWFEGRGERCVLMVFIDDATSAITSLHFSKTEDLEAYYGALSKHLINYGIPLGIYGDRCSTLCSRDQNAPRDTTQFQKALKELGCELILARSPQAKGRVERANRTLQDRLVKMFRVRGIDCMEEAHEVLEEYREEHNRLFSKKPAGQENAHRSLEGVCLEDVLSIRESRTLSKDFTVQFKGTFYLISRQDGTNRGLFKNAKVDIRMRRDGRVVGFLGGKRVRMQSLKEVEYAIMDEKEIINWKPKKVYEPSRMHPYKKGCARKQWQEEMQRYAV